MSDLIVAIHGDLPREGPGSRASTLRALQAMTALPRGGCILDIGCGPGAQTIDLTRAFDGHVVALDIHRAYLAVAARRARDAGVERRVHPIAASMTALPIADESVDVVWAEGSIYLIGFARGLREWQRCLKRPGYVAATHLSWLCDDVPDVPRQFWSAHYPAITTVAENLALAAAAGYDVIAHFVLPPSAWWDDYYGPLERRLRLLTSTVTADAETRAAIDATQRQIDLYRDYADYYGYVFYVLRLRG